MSGIFRVEWVDGGFAHLVMDHPDRKVNVLDVPSGATATAAPLPRLGRG